jgi:hypothetical protein
MRKSVDLEAISLEVGLKIHIARSKPARITMTREIMHWNFLGSVVDE